MLESQFDHYKIIGLDFETYSDVDLRTQGLQNYVDSPHFKVLLAAVCEKDALGVLHTTMLDMVHDDTAWQTLLTMLDGNTLIAAHNAGFEQAVLASQGVDLPGRRFIDTAVLARAAGVGGSLEASAAQLLGEDKVAVGADLIKRFCIPGPLQEQSGNPAFDPSITEETAGLWLTFKYYCEVDAQLSFKLAEMLTKRTLMWTEYLYSGITLDMNKTGWPVDLDLVREMDYRYHRNMEKIELDFRTEVGEPDLNLNSTTQLIAWCRARNVGMSSFDEKSVAAALKRVTKRLESIPADDSRHGPLSEVLALLHAKQALGGSSLKKLDVIQKMTAKDGRLHDQYLHVGAGATFRTSGRGVQMQNLKRLHGEGDNVNELFDPAVSWSNDQLATNLRQVFAASHPNGRLIVGDFASVESRGLAWQAGEQWKLDAYAQGQDLYKVQASMMFGMPVEKITKDQRQIGKVGELACGYGAGADAVRNFAANMGVDLDEGEALKLVRDWREANDQIVQYWKELDEGMATVMARGVGSQAAVRIPYGDVLFQLEDAPQSLSRQQNRDMHSLRITLGSEVEILQRVVHGVQRVGRNVHYWKPSERKTGPLWSDTFTNPKTKRRQHFNIYGGKLAGILTQSLCREVFFMVLSEVDSLVKQQSNVRLVGQFHDEIVLEWEPGLLGHDETIAMLQRAMTDSPLPGFPLGAEVKSAYRYVK